MMDGLQPIFGKCTRPWKEDGCNPVIVAPVINQSGTGGTVVYTTSANLTGPGEYGSVAAGSPSVSFF